jgi:hypothetical protein
VLNYGIILTGSRLNNWQLRCIERLYQSKLASLRCIVTDSSGEDAGAAGVLYAGVRGAARADLHEIFKRVPGVECCDLASADKQAVDFFLLFGSRRSGAALAHAAPYGVWYFAYGDLTQFSSDVPGFWEVYGERDVTAGFLLQLPSDRSAGVALKCGYLPTLRESFEENAEALLDALGTWPLHVCWDITHNAAAYFHAAPLPQPNRHYGIPTPLEIASMRMRERRHRAASFVRKNFCAIEWTVARVKETPPEFIGTDRRADVAYLYERNAARYFADPCVVVRESRPYVFCEEYRRSSNHGAVAVSEIREGRAHAPAPAIEESHHLSYPHVFEHDGQLYCIPESGKIRKVCLYRCVEFPHKWEFVQTLIDGFEAADSTIVRHGDRWWLFCTSSQAMPKGFYSHLYVWHAEDLFGHWTQHVQNPVKIDARSARPAGPFFVHDGALYRPAQDCSRSYGGAVRINRVDKLTVTEFHETVVGTIRPPRSRYTHGLHTLSAAGDFCVVDVERYAFNLANTRYTCTQAVKGLLLRVGFSEDAIGWIKRRMKAPQAAQLRTPQPSEIE